MSKLDTCINWGLCTDPWKMLVVASRGGADVKDLVARLMGHVAMISQQTAFMELACSLLKSLDSLKQTGEQAEDLEGTVRFEEIGSFPKRIVEVFGHGRTEFPVGNPNHDNPYYSFIITFDQEEHKNGPSLCNSASSREIPPASVDPFAEVVRATIHIENYPGITSQLL